MTPMPIAAPAPFHIIGNTAMVATEVGTSFIIDPRDLARYTELFTVLDGVALYDALLRTIRDDYRKLSGTPKSD